jgi:hypothetical protein
MRARLLGLALACSLAAAPMLVRSASPRFYPDDPIWVDEDRALDADKVAEHEDSGGYDFLNNTFLNPGERRSVRAMNVNTLDEVPDSSWWTNRIGRKPMTLEELVRGPDLREVTSLEGWTISAGKSTGLQPGFRMTDPSGHTYQIEIDTRSNPELATGAEIVGTAFYHAFGYYVVEVYLAELDPAKLVLSPKATIKDPANGRRRKLTRHDIAAVLRQAERMPNGRIRVLVSRFAEGRPAGNFRYYGTRPDDPNDVVPHEHRRELRGARVFGAWLNHDDSRGVNSLDFIVGPKGQRWVKHYMFDFGSMLGSGTTHAQVHRAGNEYIFEWAPGWLTLATLGFYTRPWMRIDYPDMPESVGRIEADVFDPLQWRPEYPNPAFDNMRPDDAFWAARIVSRFSPEAIRAIVGKARYSDPRATEYLADVLVKRREKVLRTWLNGVNPMVDLALDGSGRLTFANASVDAGAAPSAESYTLQWFRFDNRADTKTNVGEPVSVTTLEARAPTALLSGSEYIGVVATAHHPSQPLWATPATFYFRKKDGGWEWVGAER